MASGFYNAALHLMPTGSIDLDTDTLKVMLVTDYVYNADHTVVDNGANDNTDPSFKELTVSGYTGGFGGAGRKTATVTGQANNTDNRADFAIADLTWTALATGQTIGNALLIKEITNDTLSKLIACFDTTDVPTNGGDISLDFLALGSGGNLRFAA